MNMYLYEHFEANPNKMFDNLQRRWAYALCAPERPGKQGLECSLKMEREAELKFCTLRSGEEQLFKKNNLI